MPAHRIRPHPTSLLVAGNAQISKISRENESRFLILLLVSAGTLGKCEQVIVVIIIVSGLCLLTPGGLFGFLFSLCCQTLLHGKLFLFRLGLLFVLWITRISLELGSDIGHLFVVQVLKLLPLV
jgi:hypothetical protein